MAAPKRTDTLASLGAEVLASDPDLRERVRKLVGAMLDDAEYTMRFGSPHERAQLTRAIVPGLLRSMSDAEGDAGEAAQREAYERMMDQLAGRESA